MQTTIQSPRYQLSQCALSTLPPSPVVGPTNRRPNFPTARSFGTPVPGHQCPGQREHHRCHEHHLFFKICRPVPHPQLYDVKAVELGCGRLRGGGAKLLFVASFTVSANSSVVHQLSPQLPELLRASATLKIRVAPSAQEGPLPPQFVFAAGIMPAPETDPLAGATHGTSSAFSDCSVSPVASLHFDSEQASSLRVVLRILAYPAITSVPCTVFYEFTPAHDYAFATPIRTPRLRGSGGTVLPVLRSNQAFRVIVLARAEDAFALPAGTRINDFLDAVRRAVSISDLSPKSRVAPLLFACYRHLATDLPLEATLSPYTVDSLTTFLAAIASHSDKTLDQIFAQRPSGASPLIASIFNGANHKFLVGTPLSPQIVATADSLRHERAFLEHSLTAAPVRSITVPGYGPVFDDGRVPLYRALDQADFCIPSIFDRSPLFSFSFVQEGIAFVTPPLCAEKTKEEIRNTPVHPAVAFERWYSPGDYTFSTTAPTAKISPTAMAAWKDAVALESTPAPVDFFAELFSTEAEPFLVSEPSASSSSSSTPPKKTSSPGLSWAAAMEEADMSDAMDAAVAAPETVELPEGIRRLDDVLADRLAGKRISDEDADYHGLDRSPSLYQPAPISEATKARLRAAGAEIPDAAERHLAAVNGLNSRFVPPASVPNVAVDPYFSAAAELPPVTEETASSEDDKVEEEELVLPELAETISVVDGQFVSKNSFAPLIGALDADRVCVLSASRILASVAYNARVVKTYNEIARQTVAVSTKTQKKKKAPSKRDDDFYGASTTKTSASRMEYLQDVAARIEYAVKHRDIRELVSIGDAAVESGDVNVLTRLSRTLRRHLDHCLPLQRFLFGGAKSAVSHLFKAFDDPTSAEVSDVEIIVAYAAPTLTSVPQGYARFASETLLLSGDIETNPGPTFTGLDRVTPVDESDLSAFEGSLSAHIADTVVPLMAEKAFVYATDESSEDAAYFSSAVYIRQNHIVGANSTVHSTRNVLRPFAGFGFRTAMYNDLQLGWGKIVQGRSFRSMNLLNQFVRPLVFSEQLATLMRGWNVGNLSVFGPYINPRVAQNIASDHIITAMCRSGDALSPTSTYDLGHVNHKVWEMILISLAGVSRTQQFCFNGAEHAGTTEQSTVISQHPFGPDTAWYPQTQNVPANGNVGQGFCLDATSDNRALDLLNAFPIMNNGAIQLPPQTAAIALASSSVAKVYDDQAFGPIHAWFWTTVFSLSFLPLPREDQVGQAGCLARPINLGVDVPRNVSATWSSAASLQDDGYARVMIISSRPLSIPGYGIINPNANFELWRFVRAGYLAFTTSQILTYWASWRSKKGIDHSEFDTMLYAALPHVFFAVPPPDRGGMFTVDDGVGNPVNVTPRAVQAISLERSATFDAYSVPPEDGQWSTTFPKPVNCLHQEPNAGVYVVQGNAAVYNQECHMLARPTARAFGSQLLTHPLVARSTVVAKVAPSVHPVDLGRSIICTAAKVELAFTRVRSTLALVTPQRTAQYLSDPELAYGVWLDAGGGSGSVAMQSLLHYSQFSAFPSAVSTAIGADPTSDIAVSCIPAPFAAYLNVPLPESLALGVLNDKRFSVLPPDAAHFRPQTTAQGERAIDLPSNLVKNEEVMFGPTTRSSHRGHLTARLAAALHLDVPADTGVYFSAMLSDGAASTAFTTINASHGAPPLTYSRSFSPEGSEPCTVRYAFYVCSGGGISARAAFPLRVNTALSFAPSEDMPQYDHLFTPDDLDAADFTFTHRYCTPVLAREVIAKRGTREVDDIELAYVNRIRASAAAKFSSLPLKDAASASSSSSASAVASDSSVMTVAETELVAQLSRSPVRSVAFSYLNKAAIPDLRIAYGSDWPRFFSEYFVSSHGQSAFFKDYMASLTGEFVSPVYSPEHTIQERIRQGLDLARRALPAPSLFVYAAGLTQDEMQVPAVYSSLARLSWKRVFQAASARFPHKRQFFLDLSFGIHQPFATALLLAYELSRGARFLLDQLALLPAHEVVAATTEGLKAYFSAWKVLALKVGAERLGYAGNDADIMDLGILIGYTPRPDEFNDDPVTTVRDFFTPKPKSARYMEFYRLFVEFYVPQVFAKCSPYGDLTYTKDLHIDLWSLWSTSGALFDKPFKSLSSQLKKNALPFVYQASELATLFTQTSMFAKLVSKPDEKGKFRRILAVNLASLFNYVFIKTRTAFMTRADRSGVSYDSITQLGKGHERQRKLASGKAGFSVDFPNYDQQQSLEFEAIVWEVVGDCAERVADHLSAEQARTLRLTTLSKFVKLVGFSEEQIASLWPQFEVLPDEELAVVAKAAVVADVSGYVIPVFWGMLSGSPSTTVANTIAGLGIWSVSLARLLNAGIPFLGLDLNVQSGDDLDTYSTNPVSALAAYRLISSEFVMRDSDWMYRANTSVFLKVVYKSDTMIGFVNRALIPFVQRSPSSALSFSPVADISELNDLRDLLLLRGADAGALARYYYRAVDSILTSFAIPTSTSARHVPASFGGLGVLPLDYSHSIAARYRVKVPARPPLVATTTDLMSRGAVALAARAGYPDMEAGARKKLAAQAASGVVDYMRDPEYRALARGAWKAFDPPPSAKVKLRHPEPKVLDISTAMRALEDKLVILPRPRMRVIPPLPFSVLRSELGTKDALKRLRKDGKLPDLIASYPHYSLQAEYGQGSAPVAAAYPISALVSPYLSAWLADRILRSTRGVAKRCSYDATLAYVARSTELTLALPTNRAVLARYAA